MVSETEAGYSKDRLMLGIVVQQYELDWDLCSILTGASDVEFERVTLWTG